MTKSGIIIGFANQKGGTGKTSGAVHCAYYCCHILGLKVLLVDTDSQQSSSYWLKKFESDPELKIPYQVISTPEDLSTNLRILREEYELIVVDGPATLDFMTQRIIDAADLVLIPIQPGELEAHSVKEALNKIRHVREIRRAETPKAAVFFSKGDPRASRIATETIEWLQTFANDIKVMDAQIHERDVVRDAPGQGCTVWQIAKESAEKATLEYTALFDKALELVNADESYPKKDDQTEQ